MIPILMDTPVIEISNPSATTQAVVDQPTFTGLITQHPLMMAAAAILMALVFGWFGLRYWLAITRPAAIKEIETPTINRMNASALEHMVGESAEEAEAELQAKSHEAAPDDLLAAIPPEEIEIKPTKPPEKK